MRVESGSSLSTFRSCPKLYHFKYNERLSPKGYSSPLNYGSFVHALRGIHHAKGMPESFQIAAQKDLEMAVALAKAAHPEASEQIQSDLSLAQAVVNLWADYWTKSESSFGEKHLKWLDVEGEWKFQLGNLGYHSGKRDGYVEHTGWNKRFLYELKTASMYDQEGYQHRLALDHQIASNLLALGYESKPFDGCLYDIIWKPSIRRKVDRKTMPDETPTEFNQRIVETMAAAPEKHFTRLMIAKRWDDLELWRKELQAQFAALNATQVFYRNPGNCTQYGLCAFFEACASKRPEDFYGAFNKRDRKHPELAIKGE